MPTVHAPVAGFDGSVAGVKFEGGVAVTGDPVALAYFTRQGYRVGETAPDITAEDVSPDAADTAPDDVSPEPVKRGPGRPRKNPIK
jgi:hypothetical protein